MWKSLFLSLLLVFSLAQDMTKEEAMSYMKNDATYAQDGYADIPVDSLDKLHVFIEQIIQTTYPYLQESWTLANIKQKYSNETDQTLYLYSWIYVENGPNNTTNVTNLTSVVVIGHDNGTLFSIF
jgi:hypothetical protein